MQAGDNFSTLHNIIVRPVKFASTDLDINTSFTIRSLDRDTANYISIVYSWIDPQNYKYAGITFFDNQAFIDFGTVSNGTLSWNPPWPGSRIDLDWNSADPIRMTLSLRDNSQELNVNGMESLNEDSEDNYESGYVGLAYGRVQDVIFHQLDINREVD